jgi:oxygen-independent coproporphyrinogen-3 oxidase
MLEPPPLSLYVHLPWCARKCPYCDFNSHAVGENLPAEDYIAALLRDLEAELPLVWGRPVQSVFFGGGTPSLFSGAQIAKLLSGIRAILPLKPEPEVTLEANPGTVERDSFAAYRDAGVNRVSLGAQSFSGSALAAIGRIHGPVEIERAVNSLRSAGIDNFNIDLMFALPGQLLQGSLDDAQAAIACEPAHISHYQLTIEPNTAFHADPPILPVDDAAWEMQEACGALLDQAGFSQYEVSAWARPGRECLHNLNYWQYGDYLGIGAGAHGKITMQSDQTVRRRARIRHPAAWLKAVGEGDGLADDRILPAAERLFEFFLNQLRLRKGVRKTQFEARTGLPWVEAEPAVRKLIAKGLAVEVQDRLVPTELGWRFSNESQAIFLP